jgi:hypothetical protein
MKRWNVTQFNWTEWFCTDVKDREAKKEDPRHEWYHKGKGLRIVTEVDGTGVAVLSVGSTVASNVRGVEENVVASRLQSLASQGITCVAGEKQHEGCYTLRFRPRRGQNFTDAAIEVARAVATILGVRGKDLKHWLSRFKFQQYTNVRVGRDWVPFDAYLRKKHKLEDMSNTGWEG